MIDRYRDAFQEEAREVLGELEASLLELNERRDDPELIGRAFRALHTIKGSGAMFGFDEISRFTHHIENAFDHVRSGRLEARPELIHLSLTAVDQIRSLLDEAAGRGQADPAISARILEQLAALTGSTQGSSSVEKTAPAAPSVPPTEALDWKITFAPGPDLIRKGTNPLLLLRELRELGKIEKITANGAAIPALGELDPERCYVSWDAVLRTPAPPEAIHDVFIFAADDCDLKVEPICEIETPLPHGERRSGIDRRRADREAHSSSIRVSAAKLDQLVDLVGQLVTVQARLGEIASRNDDRDMQSVAEEIESLAGALRENSMSMRTLPLRSTFERFKRLVYDLGRSLNKEVELTCDGGDTELDKTVLDQLNDPLMHLIRNCMDHGIESAEERRAAGKPPVGNVHLSARHAGAQVLICVSDDGKGIDREAVRLRAVERGLIAPDARPSESEIFAVILAPGFSTAREVTDVSGRGVGMDVVRRNVEALRGSIEIESQYGAGSRITLRLPLTLAIIDGLLVRVGGDRFVMPLMNTVECVELTRQDIENAGGKHIANIRGELIPYVRLKEFLNIRDDRPDREQLMVAETEHGRFGFVVDQVLGDHQTVIKNLGRLYRDVHVISGATILGDGTVAPILDLHRIAQSAIRESTVKSDSGAHAARANVYNVKHSESKGD